MGDPAGIGPEITVKALAEPDVRKAAKFVIFGMNEQLYYAADKAEIEPFWGRHQHEKISRDYPYKVVVADYDDYSVPPWIKRPSKRAGEASIKFCLDAISAARAGIIDAVVTAPINKTSWKLAGAKWPGHTEMLADRCKSKRAAMMFAAGPLKMALATIHEALFEVRHKFTIGCVFEPIDLLNDALKEYFNITAPRIGVAALNPHASESGQFGDEEKRIISPAIALAARHKLPWTLSRRHAFFKSCQRSIRWRSRNVSRPGTDSRKIARLRNSGQYHHRHPHNKNFAGSWNSFRYLRPKSCQPGRYESSDNNSRPNG